MPPSLPAPPLSIPLEPLTQNTFYPYGTVIASPHGPLPAHSSSSTPSLPPLPPNAVLANQGTAIKHVDISSMPYLYAAAPSKRPARAVMNMFSCLPRALRDGDAGRRRQEGAGGSKMSGELDVGILERHPYTAQTFVPVGVDAGDAGRCFLVIVAPTVLDGAVSGGDEAKSGLCAGPPDVRRLRAFVARGDQAVTYAAGTWHAPMVVLGGKGIDFVVVQYANGVGEEDCQEMLLVPEAGQQRGPSVVVDLAGEEHGTVAKRRGVKL